MIFVDFLKLCDQTCLILFCLNVCTSPSIFDARHVDIGPTTRSSDTRQVLRTLFGHVIYRMSHVHVQDMSSIEDLGCRRTVLPAHNRFTALPARYMGACLPIYQVYTNIIKFSPLIFDECKIN
jgi:hypothetical protein